MSCPVSVTLLNNFCGVGTVDDAARLVVDDYLKNLLLFVHHTNADGQDCYSFVHQVESARRRLVSFEAGAHITVDHPV